MSDIPVGALKVVMVVVGEMTGEQFEQARTRLKRILARCGWTLHLRHKPSGWYASAAKRDAEGKRHEVYIAALRKVSGIETEKIKAILPSDVA